MTTFEYEDITGMKLIPGVDFCKEEWIIIDKIHPFKRLVDYTFKSKKYKECGVRKNSTLQSMRSYLLKYKYELQFTQDFE